MRPRKDQGTLVVGFCHDTLAPGLSHFQNGHHYEHGTQGSRRDIGRKWRLAGAEEAFGAELGGLWYLERETAVIRFWTL
ncbi:hypothetical protein IF1G_03788 [Cordyceps javanica]|uniref:Uncharacterized protein n=1 Tax=Cordyceps javanica TaxID=43265 RepID=A0A545V8L2_9HYPO|nr:hypothetical protein IF1G_03788 [Cordyceps javanica]